MNEISTERLREIEQSVPTNEEHLMSDRVFSAWCDLRSVGRAEIRRREEFERRCFKAADLIIPSHSHEGRMRVIRRAFTEPLEPEIEDKWLHAARAAVDACMYSHYTPLGLVGLAKAIKKAVEG